MPGTPSTQLLTRNSWLDDKTFDPSPPEHLGDEVFCCKYIPEYKHVTLSASGVGPPALVQDNDFILHVKLNKMQS